MQDSLWPTESKLTIDLPGARVTLIPSEAERIVATCQTRLKIITMWWGRGHAIRWRNGGGPQGGNIPLGGTGFVRGTGANYTYGRYLGSPTGDESREEEVIVNVPVQITRIFIAQAARYTPNAALKSVVIDRRR